MLPLISPAAKRRVLTTTAARGLTGTPGRPRVDAAGFTVPGPVHGREDRLPASGITSCGGRPWRTGCCTRTLTRTAASPPVPRTCPDVNRTVSTTPAALASTGVRWNRLATDAGFTVLGAVLIHEDRLRLCRITSCTEAATDAAVSNILQCVHEKTAPLSIMV